MNQREYLDQLGVNLMKLPAAERADILRDQQEYFAAAIEAGRTEEDIARALGDPRTLAATCVAESAITRAENSSTLATRLREIPRIFGSLLVLAPLNFIFVLGPYLAIGAILFSFWAVSLSMGFASVWGIAQFHFSGHAASVATLGLARVLAIDFFALGMGSLSGLAVIATIFLTRGFAALTIAYLRWNVNFLNRSERGSA